MGEGEFPAVGLEIVERRQHGREDAEEQPGHFPDRAEGEMICPVNGRRREPVRAGGGGPHHQLAQEPAVRKKHGADDDGEQGQVDETLDPPRLRRLLDLLLDARRGVAKGATVEQVERREDGADGEDPGGQHVPNEPEERHPVEVTEEEQRRIADRGQRTADVGDNEDEEHHMVRAGPDLVHAEKGRIRAIRN